jgi:hypothetical protein
MAVGYYKHECSISGKTPLSKVTTNAIIIKVHFYGENDLP